MYTILEMFYIGRIIDFIRFQDNLYASAYEPAQ